MSILEWGVDDVAAWASSHGFSEGSVAKFREKELDGEALSLSSAAGAYSKISGQRVAFFELPRCLLELSPDHFGIPSAMAGPLQIAHRLSCCLVSIRLHWGYLGARSGAQLVHPGGVETMHKYSRSP